MSDVSIASLAISPVLDINDRKREVRNRVLPQDILDDFVRRGAPIAFQSLTIPDDMLFTADKKEKERFLVGVGILAGTIGYTALAKPFVAEEKEVNGISRRSFLKKAFGVAVVGAGFGASSALTTPLALRNIHATIGSSRASSLISSKLEESMRGLYEASQKWNTDQWRWAFVDLMGAVRNNTLAKGVKAEKGFVRKPNIAAVVGSLHTAIATNFSEMDEASKFTALTLFNKNELKRLIDENGGIAEFSRVYYGDEAEDFDTNRSQDHKYYEDQELKTFLENYYQEQ